LQEALPGTRDRFEETFLAWITDLTAARTALSHEPSPRSRSRRLVVLVLATWLLGSCQSESRGVTIRFWAMGREGEVVQELVRDFEREHPGVHVEVQQIPWTAAHEKLLTSHVGHATPDVAQLGNTWIAEFTALKALEPLDPWLAHSSEVRANAFYPGIWATNVVDDMPYGVPWYVDTRLIFYRKDLLRQAGYDSIPQSWAGWQKAMRALKAKVGPKRYAIFLPVNEWTQPMIFGLQAGSPLLQDHATRGDFRGPEFRRAFDFYVDLFKEHLAPPVSNTEIANTYQEFERGYFAMWITGPWNLGEFRRRLPESMQGAWATAPLPGPNGAPSGLSMAGGSSLVMFKGSKHKGEAWALIEFLSRPDQQARFYRLCGSLPARTASWQDSAIANDPMLTAFHAQLERVAPWPMVPEWEQIATRLQELAEKGVRGASTPDAVLSELDHDVDRMLEKRRWLLERRAGATTSRRGG
jgi:multiple sugar transport system substrate-binding protein